MKKIFIISLVTSLLIAQNPKVYSALGDVLYNNSANIKELKKIDIYSEYNAKIDAYLKDIKKIKEYGFDVEKEKSGVDKIIYLQKLRNLSQTNDFFVRSVKNNFKASLEDENTTLFLKMIDNKMLDSQKYKSDILNYYFNHTSDINVTPIIQTLLDQDKSKEKKALLRQSKKQRQEKKMERIRENDRIKQESIKKSLEEEVAKNKSEIKKEQMEKLAQ